MSIKKETAEKTLLNILRRAIELNKNDSFMHTIDSICVFGSVLTDKPVLGDLDVAIDVNRRHCYKDNWIETIKEKYSDKIFSSFVEQLTYPFTQSVIFLKDKKKHISIHHMDDLEQLVMKNPNMLRKVIYVREDCNCPVSTHKSLVEQ